jgi:hypothetical protein
MDESDEHWEKADNSMPGSFEPTSNVTRERPGQAEKHFWQRTSTEEGIQMDESEEQHENADSSIRDSLEPTSKAMLERASHFMKQ